MLFWSFAAQSMQAYLSIHYPNFDRDDVLDPKFLDSRASWCAPCFFRPLFTTEKVKKITILLTQNRLNT